MPYNVSMLNTKLSPLSLTFISCLVPAGANVTYCADFKHSFVVRDRVFGTPCSNPIHLAWLTIAHFHSLEQQKVQKGNTWDRM